jgi:hypothetical protein
MAGLLVLGAACSDPLTGNPVHETGTYRLSPTSQWSAGLVTVVSTAFAGPNLPVILSGTDSLAVTRVNDSTVTVRLPAAASGADTLRHADGIYRDYIGIVTRFGFHGYQVVPGVSFEELVVGHSLNTVFLIGNNHSDRSTVVLVPSAGSLTTLPGLVEPAGAGVSYGPGVTPQPDQFLLSEATTGKIFSYRVWPALEQVSAMPDSIQSTWVHSNLVGQASDSTWIFSNDQFLTTVGPANSNMLDVRSSWANFLSPRGDRFVMMARASGLAPVTWMPVLDSRTGGIAFLMDGVSLVQWAAWSPTGEELFVLGRGNDPSDSLYRFDATTGARLAAAGLPDSVWAGRIEHDPLQPRLYVQAQVGCLQRLLVYDANTLSLLGTLPASGPTGCQIPGVLPTWGLAIEPTGRRGYIVGIGDPVPIYTFDLLP